MSRNPCPFQPTLPARGATAAAYDRMEAEVVFQPTLPARGATAFASSSDTRRSFQPTLPARGATLPLQISLFPRGISTHAPRTGSDNWCLSLTGQPFPFQPTLPARGATAEFQVICAAGEISTHAPRTGSDQRLQQPRLIVLISTHAPRTGSDRGVEALSEYTKIFQPTLPARGATVILSI